MATPFDLYQARQFEGLDPTKFNKEAYLEQQKSLFADTFKDQLSGLRGSYEKETGLTAENKQQAELTGKKLEELNSKTKGYLDKLKDAENGVNSTKNMLNSYTNQKNSVVSKKNTAQKNLSRSQANYNNARKAQAKIQKSYVNIKNNINNYQKYLSRFRPGSWQYKNLQNAINNAKNHKDYKAWNTYQSQMNTYAKQNNTYSKQVNTYNSQIKSWNNKINEQNNLLNQRNQVLKQVNNETNAHKQAVAQTSDQLKNFTGLSTKASAAAEKAISDAQGLQEKINTFQGRSEPLKQLEGTVQGDYAASLAASTEELKKIAANSLDPLSQKNAQNLLNQRAEQLAKTYGKNVEDVKKEMGTGVGQLSPEQFATQQDFNKFMGIEEQQAAELGAQSALNNLDAQGQPTDTSQAPPGEPTQQAQPPAPAPVEPPVVEPAVAQTSTPLPSTPPQPATSVQPALQVAQSTGTTGMPALSAPQTGMPQRPMPMLRFLNGMPQVPQANPQAAPQAQPYGGMTSAIKQGITGQLQKGFQSAMKINATNKPVTPKVNTAQQHMQNDLNKRRRAVAAQAMGIATKPTSVSKPVDQGKPFGMSQNVRLNQEGSTLTKGVGRRQPR